jgi:hypothetical protein
MNDTSTLRALIEKWREDSKRWFDEARSSRHLDELQQERFKAAAHDRMACSDELETLLAAQPSEGWHPIATAPRDRWIWFGRPPRKDSPRKFTISPYRWDESYGMWFSGTGWWGDVHLIFTHWAEMHEQPPAPPADSGSEKKSDEG